MLLNKPHPPHMVPGTVRGYMSYCTLSDTVPPVIPPSSDTDLIVSYVTVHRTYHTHFADHIVSCVHTGPRPPMHCYSLSSIVSTINEHHHKTLPRCQWRYPAHSPYYQETVLPSINEESVVHHNYDNIGCYQVIVISTSYQQVLQ